MINPQWAPLRGRPERPGSLGDVHPGRVARIIVADGLEAQDEDKGTDRSGPDAGRQPARR
jgi:hypothetical protein